MRIKKFTEFVNELNHQMTGAPLGVNQAGFGQGAHVGNWGVNYGDSSKGVRGHFGKKGDQGSADKPDHSKFPSVIMDPTSGEYIHEDEIQKLITDYEVKCKQNSEEPQKFTNIDSKVIEYIKNYLSE